MGNAKLLGIVLSLLLASSAGASSIDVTTTPHPDPGVQSPTLMNTKMTAIQVGVNDDDRRLDNLIADDTCTTPPCSLTAGTTLAGVALVTTANDDDVPDAGDFGAADGLNANGAIDVNYVATVAGDANIIVSGSGTVARPVTLAVGSPVTIDAEAHPKLFSSATSNVMVKVDSSGNALASNLTTDAAGNDLNVPGTLTVGGVALNYETTSDQNLIDLTTDCIAIGHGYLDYGATPAYWKCINATTNDWILVGP